MLENFKYGKPIGEDDSPIDEAKVDKMNLTDGRLGKKKDPFMLDSYAQKRTNRYEDDLEQANGDMKIAEE
jgi:hypothetical protein